MWMLPVDDALLMQEKQANGYLSSVEPTKETQEETNSSTNYSEVERRWENRAVNLRVSTLHKGQSCLLKAKQQLIRSTGRAFNRLTTQAAMFGRRGLFTKHTRRQSEGGQAG